MSAEKIDVLKEPSSLEFRQLIKELYSKHPSTKDSDEIENIIDFVDNIANENIKIKDSVRPMYTLMSKIIKY